MKYAKMSLTLLVAAMAASPVYADFVGVSRCDQENNGTFTPGLLTVEQDGTRTFYPVGENGLTSTIVFNCRMATDWVEGQNLYPAGTMFGECRNYICGVLCEECEEDVQEESVEEPQEEPDSPTVEPTE